MDLFDKCINWKENSHYEAKGLYPYFRPINSAQDTEVNIGDKNFLMLGSNSYMGLTNHPEVMEAAIKATQKYGSGNGGSRFLNGTLDIHLELEARLAKYLNAEAALVFSTGYQTNVGVISALVGRNEKIYLDRLNHACIVDGSRMSFGEAHKYHHNDIEDLERILALAPLECAKLICTDGVFSMEGDIARLPEIINLAQKYNARVLVDDAHGTGVLGPNGRGTAAHFGLEKETDLISLTFSKSFATVGGAVCGPKEVINFLKHHSRALIFSASLPASVTATALASLNIIEREPERLERLWDITRRMRTEIKEIGFDVGETQTPIIPIIVGDMEKTFIFWRELTDQGVFVNPVVPPAVPSKRCLIRTSFMATHTDEQLDRAIEALKSAGKKAEII